MVAKSSVAILGWWFGVMGHDAQTGARDARLHRRARTLLGLTRALGNPERTVASWCLHAASGSGGGLYLYRPAALPEAVVFEAIRAIGVLVLLCLVELLRRRCDPQLRLRGGVFRLVLLAQVRGNRDGGEYPYYHHYRIVAITITVSLPFHKRASVAVPGAARGKMADGE